MTLTDAHHIVESSVNAYAGSLKFHAVQMILMEHFPTGDDDAEKPDPPKMPENTLIREGLKDPGNMPERLKPAITYIQNDPTPPPSPKVAPVEKPKRPAQDERFGAFNISAPAAANVKEAAPTPTKPKDAKKPGADIITRVSSKKKLSSATAKKPGADIITRVSSKKKLATTAAAQVKAKRQNTDLDRRTDGQDRNVESSPFYNKGAQGAATVSGRPGFRRMLSRNRSLRKVTEGVEDGTTGNTNIAKDPSLVSGGADLRRTTSHKKYPDRPSSIGGKPITGNTAPGVPSPSPRVSLPIFGRKDHKDANGNGGSTNESSGTPGFFSKMSRPRADSTAGDSVDDEEIPLPKSAGTGMARGVRKVFASFRTPRARTFLGKLRKSDNKSNASATPTPNANGTRKDKTTPAVAPDRDNDRMTMLGDRPETNPRSNAGDEPSQAQRRKMMPRVQSGGQLFRETGSKLRKLTRSASAASVGS